MDKEDIREGKTLATIAHLTPIGLLVAISLNLEKRNPYIFFHARQMIGLIIMVAFSNICEKYVNSWFGTALWFVTFISWLYCLLYALKGEYKLLPVLGQYFQDWFKNLK
ncbi:hypothetical protein BWZ20_02170 [Winogradskyella sp. J14-2]|uniref:hypothetical protein n=1 Tax=Winogradskyella sp. J14-2 TaxID=1936080 RepID=UPI000972A336|nr:hypothetical protein [Winogradskyella sp. J14-2]APY07181.1 hypothetical protein BWZ20_02170 [Winogradskyella sp. J14-2]